MRDLIILAFILGSVPVCLFNPYYGVLMWTWIAYFNPHRYAWGIAYDFPVAQVIAYPTLIGMLFARKLNRQILTRETILLLMLWLWFCFTMFYATQVPAFAGHVATGMDQLKQVSKILLMTFPTILLVTSPKRLKYLLLVISLSFGVRAIFGAIFVFKTGGEYRVYGPADSFIEDNNAFALALNMVLPMMFFLAREVQNRWLRGALYLAFGCSIVCVILTYSRGGILGLAVVLGAICIKAHRKLLGSLMLLAAGLVVFSYAPEKWMTRMSGFLGGEVDGSAQQRLITWRTAWNFVQDYPITGGGFDTSPDPAVFQRYAPEALPGGFASTGAHSIYFQMLGNHGFVGFGLFLSLLGSSWASLRNLRRRARSLSSAQWVVSYADMMEASLLAYMVSGAFLGLAYFDLYFELIALVIVIRILHRRDVLAASTARIRTDLEGPVGELVKA